MLADIGQPQPIRAISGEVPVDSVVVDRWSWPFSRAAAGFAERTPPPVRRADPPRCPTGQRLTRGTGFVGEEPIAEFRVVAVSVEQGVRPVGLGEFRGGDRARQPPIVGLASELEHPARHHDGYPVGGELFHERVDLFPGS